jgi:ubiquinone/menaquinone biosynthesis C-methylase UbiE
MQAPDYLWNEMQQVGTDYSDLAEVEAYDLRMAGFRDVDSENSEMLRMLGLPTGAAVLEIGCGTGRFARASARAGLMTTAIDVSAIMLDYLRKRATSLNLPGITTQHAGFLTMEFPGESFDAAVSGAALHHLPDAWKLVALRNVARVLKSKGQFMLRDVVFALAKEEAPESCFERFSSSFPNMRIEAARHVRQEFSTYDWIMEGLLIRAGFEIKLKDNPSGNFATYHCVKP